MESGRVNCQVIKDSYEVRKKLSGDALYYRLKYNRDDRADRQRGVALVSQGVPDKLMKFSIFRAFDAHSC